MLGAVLDGSGLEGVAELAAQEIGGPVAIVLRRIGLVATSPVAEADQLLAWAAAAENGRPPAGVEAWVPVIGDGDGIEEVGRVVALAGARGSGALVDREQVLRWAAAAALTEIAAADAARPRSEETLRLDLLEGLRSGAVGGDQARRRAQRLGADLEAGTTAIAARAGAGRAPRLATIVNASAPGAIAAADRGEILVLLSARSARTDQVLELLRGHGPTVASSLWAGPDDAGRALAQAELMLAALDHDPALAGAFDSRAAGRFEQQLRELVTDPDQLERCRGTTVASVVRHDHEYRTNLLATLEAFLANDRDAEAAAAAVRANLHTVAYRLDRIRELSGLDPWIEAERERLELGISAHRLLEATRDRPRPDRRGRG